jgi:hypothetical protein
MGGVHRGTLQALHFARSLSNDVTAVYVAVDPLEEEKVRTKWSRWGDGVRLHVEPSPYRLLYEPLLDYLERMVAQRQPDEVLTVVVPEFLPTKWWQHLLHMQTALVLRRKLRSVKDIVIMEVPYHLQAKVSKN